MSEPPNVILSHAIGDEIDRQAAAGADEGVVWCTVPVVVRWRRMRDGRLWLAVDDAPETAQGVVA